jgi:hypothetical protein
MMPPPPDSRSTAHRDQDHRNFREVARLRPSVTGDFTEVARLRPSVTGDFS